MKRLFSLVAITVYSAAFFMAGMMVVNLYALYVLVYTGAVLMIGIYVGERVERRLSLQAVAEGVKGSAVGQPHVRETTETDQLTLKGS